MSHAIVSSPAQHQEAFVERQTGKMWKLEQRATAGYFGNPETFLEEVFRVRRGSGRRPPPWPS